MKILAFIVSVLLMTALEFGAIIAVVIALPDTSPVPLLVSGLAIAAMFYSSLLLGSLTVYWDVSSSEGSARYFRRWQRGVASSVIAGALALTVISIATGMTPAVPAAIIAAAIVLFVLAAPIGTRLRRYFERRRTDAADDWSPASPAENRRTIMVALITFVVTIAVAAIALLVLVVALDEPNRGELWGFSAVQSLALACFAAGFAVAVRSFRISRRLRDATGGDLGRVRRIARVVIRRRNETLDEADRVAAARYAAIYPGVMAYQFGFLGLLYAGLLLQQLSQLLRAPDDSLLAVATAVFLVVALAIFIPIGLRQVRRSRAYAAEHAELLTDPSAGPAPEATPQP